MKRMLSVFLLGLLGCSSDEVDPPTGHERVAPLDGMPLAVLAHGDTVFLAADAELAKLDDSAGATSASRALVRIADGRYRECPWEPWQRWDHTLGIAPTISPDGRQLAITAHLCGTWAWPIDGGEPLSLARANRKAPSQVDGENKPVWRAVTNVPAVRDGDGWIVCGEQDAYGRRTEIWSLAGDGSPREKIAETAGECTSLTVDPSAIYVSIGTKEFGRFDRTTHEWRSLLKAKDRTLGELRLAGVTTDHLVVIAERSILRVPKNGGPPETIVADEKAEACFSSFLCFGAAVDETHVYWTNGRVLSRTPHADITHSEEILGRHEERTFEVSTLPTLAVTRTGIWVALWEGPLVGRRPWLARVPKP